MGPSASDGWMRFYSIDRGIWASPPPKMTIFSTGEVFVVILPVAAERFGVAYNASQFGSFVTKRQIPSGLLKDSSPPSTVCGQISVLHEVKGGKDGADNRSDGRTDESFSKIVGTPFVMGMAVAAAATASSTASGATARRSQCSPRRGRAGKTV